MHRTLTRLVVVVACLSGSLALAVPTGSIFFSSTGPADGSNVQLILNGGAPINSADSGWYDSTGVHDPNNTNYIAGLCSDCGGPVFRNFFVFNIPTAAIVTATLNLNTFTYDSTNPFETYTLFDITTDLNTLLGGTGGIAAYNDLGSGTVYGTRDYTAPDANQFRSITLNAAAIAALQASAGGTFALGGALDSPQTTPEPVTISLLGLSLVALIAVRHRLQG